MRKIILTLGALLLCISGLCAQQVICYDMLYLKGKSACLDRQFNTALQKLRAARGCPDIPRVNDIDSWISRSQKGLAERNAWNRARNSDTRDAYNDYLRQYPDGYYARRADEAIRGLELSIQKPVLESTPGGSINWTESYVEASGQAVIDLKKWSSETQAIAMATRGAEAVAKANLLESVQGVHIERSTTVKDMMAESDLITTRVEGLVKGARPVGQPTVANGMVTLTLRMPVFGPGGVTAAALPPVMPPEGTDTDPADSVETELVFRLPSGSGRPAIFPTFVDENGALLLDGSASGSQTTEPLVRYSYADTPAQHSSSSDLLEDAQGRWIVPEPAIPDFHKWLNRRKSGAAAPPIRLLVP